MADLHITSAFDVRSRLLDVRRRLGHPKRAMAKKKKPRLRVHKEARRRARLGIGLPPPERTIPNKRDKSGKPAKHKRTLGDLVAPE
jgi:hypothetical protein